MNKIARGYIEELQKVYKEHLEAQARKREEEYNQKLSELYELAFDLVPEELTMSLRDEDSQKMRALKYLKGECDTLDRRGDIYPEEIHTIEVNLGENRRKIEYNIIGVINNSAFQSIKELQKIDFQSNIKNQDSVFFTTPYHTLHIAKNVTLLCSKCFRYLVTEEKYRELFKYILYEYICKDLGGEPDAMYMSRLERIKNELKTNFMMKIEGCKDRNIVSLNYFRHERR